VTTMPITLVCAFRDLRPYPEHALLLPEQLGLHALWLSTTHRRLPAPWVSSLPCPSAPRRSVLVTGVYDPEPAHTDGYPPAIGTLGPLAGEGASWIASGSGFKPASDDGVSAAQVVLRPLLLSTLRALLRASRSSGNRWRPRE